jgi:hypothetical protein
MPSDRVIREQIVADMKKCIVEGLKPAEVCLDEIVGDDEHMRASVIRLLRKSK